MKQQQIIDLVRETIRRKHFSYKTEKTYCHWVARYCRFLVLHPGGTSTDKMTAYLTSLAKDGVSASTQNQAFNALLCMYRDVLKIESQPNSNRAGAS